MSFRSVPWTAMVLVLALASSAFAFTFGAPVAVDDSRQASEPGINADSSGRIFINAPNGLLGPSRVWRSTNAGQSFTFVGPGNVGVTPAPSVILGGGDSNVSIDSANNLYFIDLWLGDSSSAVSHDNGSSWQGQPLSGVPIQDRPWVSADPRPNNVGAAFTVTDQIGTGLWMSESIPGPLAGVVYLVPILEVTNQQRGLVGAAPPGNLVTNLKGDTYNVYSIFTGSNGAGLGLGKLPAGAFMVTDTTIAPANSAHDQTQAFPVIAVDNAVNDNLYLVWTDPVSANEWDIRFASFNGSAWSNPVTVGHGVYPWITAQAPGKVDIAWYSAERSGYIGDSNAAPASAVWDVDLAQSVNALAATATFTAPVQAATGAKSGAICTKGTGCSGDRELGDFMSITHDNNGNALISYVSVPSAGQSLVRFVPQASGTTIN